MGALLSGLSTALSTGQAAQNEGNIQSAQMQQGNLLTQIKLAQQMHEQQIEDALKQSQKGYYDARGNALLNPKDTGTVHQLSDGTYVMVHADGSATPVTMRGAGAPPSPNAPTDQPPTSTPAPDVGAPDQPQGPQNPTAPVMPPVPLKGKVTPDKAASEIPGTPEWKAAEQYRASLNKPTLVPVKDPNDPTGQRVILVPNTQAAGMEPAPKAGGAGGLSGQTMMAQARMAMSVADLKQSIQQMDDFENDPKNLAKLTPAQQAEGVAATTPPNMESHGIGGMLGNVASTYAAGQAASDLAQNNPEFSKYLQNRQRVATALTEVLPRPNQQLLQIEKGLSGVDAGWTPATIQNVQARRRAALDAYGAVLNQAQGTRGGTPRSSLPPLDARSKAGALANPNFANYLKAHGYTPADWGGKP